MKNEKKLESIEIACLPVKFGYHGNRLGKVFTFLGVGILLIYGGYRYIRLKTAIPKDED